MISFKKIEDEEELIFLNEVRNDCAEQFLHNPSTYTLKETKLWYFIIKVPYYIVHLNGSKIGYFRLSNYSKENNTMYIGMDLHKDYRGKGLAYQSYIKFIPYIFNLYNLNKLSLEVLSTNIPAYKLYKKLGFIEEGRKRQEIYRHNEYIDSIIMSMLKTEMLSNKIYGQ